MLEFPSMCEVEKAFVPVCFQRIQRQEIEKGRIVVLPLILSLGKLCGAAGYLIVIKQDKSSSQRKAGCHRRPDPRRSSPETESDDNRDGIEESFVHPRVSEDHQARLPAT